MRVIVLISVIENQMEGQSTYLSNFSNSLMFKVSEI